MTPAPVVLAANQPARFYRGGARIDRFRGNVQGPDYRPEDWVGATTTIAGAERLGLSVLPDGMLLRDAVAADPAAWLGAAHVDAFGASTMILVKLLDAGERLPVHAHPDDAFARTHAHRPFGKAEAWFILEPGEVHLGLQADIDRADLLRLVEAQDTAALLGLLHTRRVAAGDAVYVPPGELHAIGEGVLLLEVQQPEDLSILLEWEGFALDGESDGHLGLGFDRALEAVETDAMSGTRLSGLIRTAGHGPSILPRPAERYFRLERRVVPDPVTVDAGFSILVVESGGVAISTEGGSLQLRRGATVAIPHAAGPVTLDGDGVVLLCRPPLPSPTLTPRA